MTQYEGQGPLLHTGLKLYDVEYAFDYAAETGIHGYVWNEDGHVPARPTTLVLWLEENDQYVSIYLSLFGMDSDRKKFQFHIDLSDPQPDDPRNLCAGR